MKKKTKRLNFSTIMTVLIVIIVGCIYYLNEQMNTKTSKDLVQSNKIGENIIEIKENLENEIIKEVSYIEIKVYDKKAGDLTYTKPITIKDKEIINKLKNDINSSKEYPNFNEEIGPGGWFEASPILTFYMTNGKKIKVMARDNFNKKESKGKFNMFMTWSKEDESDKKIYKINQKLESELEEIYLENK